MSWVVDSHTGGYCVNWGRHLSSQAAEELSRLKGTGFSPYITNQKRWALAPEAAEMG
jgi:hypothetical protein